jgi:hypothetical protein
MSHATCSAVHLSTRKQSVAMHDFMIYSNLNQTAESSRTDGEGPAKSSSIGWNRNEGRASSGERCCCENSTQALTDIQSTPS